MTIEGKAALVTGANRGIGRALVEEALSRGAKRIYAGTRHPFVHPDERVIPVMLDVTNTAQIEAAVETIESLDMLINNAGVALYDDLSDRSVLEQHLAVNLFGTYGITQAFLPMLIRSGGAIVNNVSMMAMAPLPITPAYAISKAAAAASPESVARAIFDGVEKGDEEIFPDPTSEALAESWHGGMAKALVHEYAAFVQAQAAA
jgi:NAD(P)-dependent dehydrogenase (short-subunit alcohol dehydrogenase family)